MRWAPSSRGCVEQDAIARHIDEATVDLIRAVDRAGREIALLREYRTRLIADVVTGKLDVREAAARLSEATEEPESPDEPDALIDSEESVADEGDKADEEAEA